MKRTVIERNLHVAHLVCMGELRVDVGSSESSDEMAGSGNKSDAESGKPTVFLILTILGGAAGLAAAVWYPTSALVDELKVLVSHLENQTTIIGSISNKPTSSPDSVHADLPRDCHDIQLLGASGSGLYKIYPNGIKNAVDVYCDMETDNGGWLVIQRRMDGSVDFFREWDEYQFGFGDMKTEFWFGLEYLHLITNQGWYELRIDMDDFEGEKKFAKYKLFYVDSRKTKFLLSVGGYSGTAGDSLRSHNGMMFSTKDSDNDIGPGNCAASFKGGFWYSNCHFANPNGEYLSGEHETLANGVNWHSWKGYKYSMKYIDMKIRPL